MSRPSLKVDHFRQSLDDQLRELLLFLYLYLYSFTLSLFFLADFKREDIAAALVNMSIMNTVQMIHKTCVESNCKRVFMAGSYANHPYMKEKFTYEWLNRLQEAALYSGSSVSTKSGTLFRVADQ